MAGVPPPPEQVRLSADDLIKEYVKDAKAADRKFSHGVVVFGEVAGIYDKGRRIRFKSQSGSRYVDACFGVAPDGVQKNQTIAVAGELEEGWQKNVLQMLACSVVPNDQGGDAQPALTQKK